jgi:hypothetical protein
MYLIRDEEKKDYLGSKLGLRKDGIRNKLRLGRDIVRIR